MTRSEAIEFVTKAGENLSETARLLNRLARTFDTFALGFHELAKEIEKGFDDEA